MQILDYGREVLNLEGEELINQASKLDDNFSKAVLMIKECKGKLIISGVGKSGHIAAKMAATFASTGTPSFFLHPTEAMHGDLGMIGADDLILAISFSGESSELLAILPHIKKRGIKVISMAKKRSSLDFISDCNLDLTIKKEACPLGAAPTVSTTLTLALGDALAVSLMRIRDFKEADFARFHPGGSLGKKLFLKVSDVMRKNFPVVNENADLKTAIEEISSGSLGNVIIEDENGNLKAVLSDGDLRRALENPNFSLDEKALNYACKSPKFIKDENMLAYEALKIIHEYKIQILVVCKDTKPLGVLHIHDLTALGL